MRHLIDLFGRFRRDESGAFAIVFAVLAIVLIAMSGAVVDFTSVQQARTKAQVALDAAALALQPTIYNTGVTTVSIKPQAEALLVNRLADAADQWGDCTTGGPNIPVSKPPCVVMGSPSIDVTAGTLTLTATLTIPMNFVSLIGVSTLKAQIVSVATRQKLNLEVAMVLDNSGSMTTSFGSGTRMSTLQASANCAVNILFYGVKTCSAKTTGITQLPDVKMALVPFNDEVNVGTSHASDFWIDRTGGNNTFDNDNFDNDDNPATAYTKTTDRIALFNQISYNGSPLSWGGCVEARINNAGSEQYDTDDTTPVAGNTDTLFVPLFAPDEPDDTYSISSGGRTHSYSYSNNYIDDTPSACAYVRGNCSVVGTTTANNPIKSVETDKVTTYDTSGHVTGGPTTNTINGSTSSTTTSSTATLTTPAGVVTSGPSVCSCSGETLLTNTTSTGTATTTVTTTGPTSTTVTNKNSRRQTTGTTTTIATVKTTTTSTVTTATQTCVAHYQPTGLSDRVLQERLCKYTGAVMTTKPKIGFGPNADCPATAIQPLTDSPTTITAAVNAMVANGNTNVQEGTAWGFRVLSPTEPFTEGLAYDKATSKVMIVMTDGENTYDDTDNMNGSELYAAYAYPYNSYDRDTRGSGAPSRGRMGDVGWSDSQFETQINTRLATTCANAKSLGITIYTIGLATDQTSDPTGNTTLLTNCASDPTDAYFPSTASDLQGDFVAIANQLAALRLSK